MFGSSQRQLIFDSSERENIIRRIKSEYDRLPFVDKYRIDLPRRSPPMSAAELNRFKSRLRPLEIHILRSEFESRLMNCHIAHGNGNPPEARVMQELIAIWKELRRKFAMD
jgi:hypothetical protein